MRETILLCNQLNQTEFLRTLSKSNSKYHFLRVMNDIELLEYIYASFGKRIHGEFLNEIDQAYIYFKLKKGKTFKDSIDIASAINSYQECIIKDTYLSMEESLDDDFKLKKNLIMSAYQEYIEYKKENGFIDKYDLISNLPNGTLDVDLLYIEEFPITKVMLEVIKNIFPSYKMVSIQEFINTHSTIKNIQGCYGITNEIDYVLSTIKKENMPLDDVSLVFIHKEDLIYFMDYQNRYQIPTTYRMGVSVLSTNPGILLKYILDLDKNYYGVDGYRKLFNSLSFDTSIFKEFFMVESNGERRLDERKYKEFIQYAGWLRLDFYGTNTLYKDLYETRVGNALEFLDKELKKGLYSFIKKFSINGGNSNDSLCLATIKNTLDKFDEYDIKKEDRWNILNDLLNKNVGGKLFNEGALNVTTIDNAFGCLRKNTFIVGLDFTYPGNPKENYLIFDKEYKKIDENEVFTSSNIIHQKEELFNALLKVSSNTYITYPTYTLEDLKSQNPSSLIVSFLDQFKKENEHPYGYLDSIFNLNKDIMASYLNNESLTIENNNFDIVPFDTNSLLNKEYSPSKIFDYLNDNPLKFILESFYRVYIDDSDDPFKVIPANIKGDMIHNLMEGFQKNEITLEELKNKANISWNYFIKMRPPLVDMKEEYDDFMEGVIKSYEQDPGNTFDSAEVEYHYTFPNGIKVGGRYDRLEIDKNGKYILVDYKTGKKSHHIDEDPKSCIQGLLYAEIIEKSRGITISKIEYRYPYAGINSITNSRENKEYMYQALDSFKEKILSGEFNCLNQEYEYEDKYLKLISLMKAVKR